jgi:hypothetical protein
MIKLDALIVALQEQRNKHGNIDLSVEIIPAKDVPNENTSKYFHVFGPWFVSADNEKGKCKFEFELQQDKQYGDWLSLIFNEGRMDGELERLSGKDLARKVEKQGKN